MVPDELNVYLWREGFHLFFPMRGTDHWRVVGILPAELRGREDLTFEDVIPSVRREAGADLSFKACSWYLHLPHSSSACRAISRPPLLSARRCGTHPQPGRRARHEYRAAGCVQPGVEARACRRRGGRVAALLDSYEDERMPVAKRLLSTTDRAFSLIVSDNWLAGLLRTRVLANGRGFCDALRKSTKACIHDHLPDRHRVPRQAVYRNRRPAWLQMRRAQEIVFRGCESSCSLTAQSKTCSRSSTTRDSI